MLKLIKPDHLKSTIDHIGRLQASIRELETKLKASKRELVGLMQAQDIDRASGELFAATLVDKDVSRVDWKTVAAKFKPSHQLVTAHTKTVHQTYPVITARKVP